MHDTSLSRRRHAGLELVWLAIVGAAGAACGDAETHTIGHPITDPGQPEARTEATSTSETPPSTDVGDGLLTAADLAELVGQPTPSTAPEEEDTTAIPEPSTVSPGSNGEDAPAEPAAPAAAGEPDEPATPGFGSGGFGSGGFGGSAPGGTSSPAPGTGPQLSECIELSAGTSSGDIGTAAVCYFVPEPVQGWQVSNLQGRTLTVNGETVTPPALPTATNGGYAFSFTAGEPSYTAFSTW